MSPRRSPKLALQTLEARDTPATFGEAWLDGQHLTLSFAKEGTSILGTSSNLGGILSPLGEPAAKHEILRAFQVWAARTNLNVGLVADHGTAFEISGALQGDHRFGDIRIAARPLASDVVAITTPSGPWSSNSGDILLNRDKTFTIGGANGTYDLYSVFLQEAGHAFGLGGSSDTASVMHQTYTGVRTGLSVADVTNVQTLYGVRLADPFEGSTGNDTQATATTLTGHITADLTTAADADWYAFTAPAGVGTWVRLKAAGVSLLAPRIEVYNAAGELLASGQSTDPQANNLIIALDGLGAGTTYYIKVSAARTDDFGVGAYVLGVDALGGLPGSDPNALVSTEVIANGLSSSSSLDRVKQLVSRPGDYFTRSSLGSPLDVDVFKVKAPAAGAVKHHLVVSVAGVGATGLKPAVEVYTPSGYRVAALVASKSENHLIVSVSNVTAEADYLIRVTSSAGSVGNYDVAAVFRTVLPSFHGSSGQLSDSVRSTSATMNVYQSQVFHFNLAAYGFAPAGATVQVRVYNSANQVVFQMAAAAGQVDSGTTFLRRGSYRVEVRLTGDWAPTTYYGLQMYGLTDPEGALPTDPTGGSSGGTGDPLPPPPDSDTTVVIIPPPAPPPNTTWF